MLASKYELDTTTQYLVITIFNWIRYVVTLNFDLLTLELCHVMPLGWVNPCTKFEQDMTYHSRVRMTTIFH